MISSAMVGRPDQPGRAEINREVSSIEAVNEATGSLRHCPDCGSDNFTQHAVRG